MDLVPEYAMVGDCNRGYDKRRSMAAIRNWTFADLAASSATKRALILLPDYCQTIGSSDRGSRLR
jgi:hypothetical protein